MSEANDSDCLPLFPLAHDLRQPLRSMVAAAERLGRHQEVMTEAVAAAVHDVLRAARRQDALLGAVMEYDAAGASALGPAVPVSVAIQGACMAVEAYRLEQGGTILWPERGSLNSHLKVPVAAEKALVKVLHNAIKFHEAGQEPEVRIATVEDGRWVEVLVSDRGLGVAPEFAGKIFDPFARLHSLDRFDGAGLGLTIARRIVRRLGGSISWQDPGPAAGSVFVVRLPASEV